ncbi:MAG TPA: right-handed parallel beta-helix repeat-containing protein [Candidatus Kapabacteria bacterium]|nr:right-handed parallel beta-helix repeat-containing protein [Candidatus Kapabacteria bacterium]
MTADEITRLNYYERQFLGARDFQTEQEYHIEMRRRHNLAHHVWGIVAGLELEEIPKEGTVDEVDVYINPGIAIDGFGREIVVLDPVRLDPALLQKQSTDNHYEVLIGYSEERFQQPAAGYQSCDVADQRGRVLETYKVFAGTPKLVHNDVTIAGETVTPETIVQDGSVPYQVFPVPGTNDKWLMRLGSAHWDGKKLIAAAPGRLLEERAYIGQIAETILAPNKTLLLRDRSTTTPIAAGDDGVAVLIEGSLEVKRDVDADADLTVAGNTTLTGTLDVTGAATFKADVQADKNLHVNKDVTIDGKLGVGTASPAVKVQIDGGTNADYGSSTGYLVIGDVNGTNLVIDDNEILARKNAGASTLHLQANGGELRIHDNKNSVTSKVVVTENGSVGIGTTGPNVRVHIDDSNDVSLNNGSGLFLLGSLGSTNIVMDDNEIQARDNGGASTLHFQAEGGDLHIHRWHPGTDVIVKDNGNVGIGTDSPSGKLDVHGNLRYYGTQFSTAGTSSDTLLIAAPLGTTLIWNIIVSPMIIGQPESNSEYDNALIRFHCYVVDELIGWRVYCHYWYRNSNNQLNAPDYGGDVNYLIVPK